MEQSSDLCPGVPLHDVLTAAAKVVGMLCHHTPGDDPFAKLFSVQGDIEAFATTVETPLEAALAEGMRFMSAEMMRRRWFYTSHPHAQLVAAFAEVLRFAPYRFAKKGK